jgi:phage-related protein
MTAPAYSLYPTAVAFPTGPLPGAFAPADNGLQINIGAQTLTGYDSGNNCNWHTYSPLQGWDSSAASSRQQSQRTRGIGGFSGPRTLAPRVVSLQGVVEAVSQAGLQSAIDDLNAAVSLQDTLLTVTRDTDTRSVICARQDEVLWTDLTDVSAQWSIALACDDPRQFATAISATTGMPASSGGLTFPAVFPWSFATISSGIVTLNNQGNASAPTLIRIDGPITTPTVTHVGTGMAIGLSLTLASGEWVVIDVEAQTVRAQGTSSRNQYITSRGWVSAQPGSNSWALTAPSGSGQLTVTITPAWL